MKYTYILSTILFTVFGQLILKWQVNSMVAQKTMYSQWGLIWQLLFNPWVILSLCFAFFAALSWMLAVSRMSLSYAYPFMSLSFIIVMILSGLFFQETLGWQKILGTAIIILGILVISRATS